MLDTALTLFIFGLRINCADISDVLGIEMWHGVCYPV